MATLARWLDSIGAQLDTPRGRAWALTLYLIMVALTGAQFLL